MHRAPQKGPGRGMGTQEGRPVRLSRTSNPKLPIKHHPYSQAPKHKAAPAPPAVGITEATVSRGAGSHLKPLLVLRRAVAVSSLNLRLFSCQPPGWVGGGVLPRFPAPRRPGEAAGGRPSAGLCAEGGRRKRSLSASAGHLAKKSRLAASNPYSSACDHPPTPRRCTRRSPLGCGTLLFAGHSRNLAILHRFRAWSKHLRRIRDGASATVVSSPPPPGASAQYDRRGLIIGARAPWGSQTAGLVVGTVLHARLALARVITPREMPASIHESTRTHDCFSVGAAPRWGGRPANPSPACAHDLHRPVCLSP